MAQSSAERVAAYRARQKAAGAEDSSQRNKASQEAWRTFEATGANQKPFVGCDGEGAGADAQGRQLYLLFRMGERELFTGEHLGTEEILDFICDDPGGSILVGFSFGYDVTMILRDLPRGQLDRLFEPKSMEPGKSRYTWFKDFDIEYLSKQYLRVRRSRTIVLESGERKRVPIPGSSRTIFETFGFFQSSFVKCINNFEVGTKAEREMVAANKARRGEFVEMTKEERDYCARECEMLAELMEKLREYCHAAGIKPRTWNGAGKLASALHKLHDTPRAETIQNQVPKDVADMANMAYYGGRFEISRTGMIEQEVHEYDIRSAYPDAMRSLPCLEHGIWHRVTGKHLETSTRLFVAHVAFNHPDLAHGQMCGLPVRSREGHLYWPLQGGGTYWAVEIKSAEKLGCKVKYKGGWEYERTCHCKPFDWVEPLYDYRRRIGSSGPGYPIKLGINSLYGKLAQRKGSGPYANMVWAGLITALTRSKLLDAAALAPGRIAMLATDGIYSLDPLPDLEEGERLGQWEYQSIPGLFIVQPGLYWSPELRKRKSRGLPGKFFEEPGMTEGFENAWLDWKNSVGSHSDVDGGLAFPSRSVDLVNFIGLKLALSRGKPETAGMWRQEQRRISFDYRNKRDGHIWPDDGAANHILTAPRAGGALAISLPHRDFLKAGGHEPWEAARAMLEDQPDYVDLGPPFME